MRPFVRSARHRLEADSYDFLKTRSAGLAPGQACTHTPGTAVRRFIEQTLNNMNNDLVDELFAPDYVNHLVPGGREGFKQFFPMLHSAFPDLKWHFIVERLMAEGDYVMARATMRVTNAGKEATGSGLAEFRLANGKTVEDWPISEVAALLQQVGVTLPTG